MRQEGRHREQKQPNLPEAIKYTAKKVKKAVDLFNGFFI